MLVTRELDVGRDLCNRHYRSGRPRLLSWVLVIDLYTSNQRIVRFAPATLNLTYADMRKADGQVLPGLGSLSGVWDRYKGNGV